MSQAHPKIPIIVGPTGVGKSEIAYHLAQRIGAEIISADAFQIYKGMEVGTAQPPKEWRSKVPHHLVGIRELDESWNAVEFAKEAKKIITKKRAQGKKLLVVGGAGFYLRALVEGAPSGAAPSPEIRTMVAEKVEELGNEKSHLWLSERDPLAAKRIHVNDTMRICRALEKTYGPTETSIDFEPLGRDNVVFFGIERAREKLDRLLQLRTETMWKNGLLPETRKLMERGIPVTQPIWGAIGYAEAAGFIRNEITQLESIEKIYRRTRQYAKRQWTWFKHQHAVLWINCDDFSDPHQPADLIEKQILN